MISNLAKSYIFFSEYFFAIFHIIGLQDHVLQIQINEISKFISQRLHRIVRNCFPYIWYETASSKI
jgi:hypothetical protein